MICTNGTINKPNTGCLLLEPDFVFLVCLFTSAHSSHVTTGSAFLEILPTILLCTSNKDTRRRPKGGQKTRGRIK